MNTLKLVVIMPVEKGDRAKVFVGIELRFINQSAKEGYHNINDYLQSLIDLLNKKQLQYESLKSELDALNKNKEWEHDNKQRDKLGN